MDYNLIINSQGKPTTLLKLYSKMVISQIDFRKFSKNSFLDIFHYRGVFRSQSKIYYGAFLQKIVKLLTPFAKKVMNFSKVFFLKYSFVSALEWVNDDKLKKET